MNRLNVSILVVAVSLVCLMAGWQLHALALPVMEEKPRPYVRTFAVRELGGRREVFVRTTARPEGNWLPLVESTESPLAELIPSWETPGPVVHVNRDGTAVMTDYTVARLRVKSDPGHKHGWPMPPGGWRD